ncbi:ribosome assembly RNA-binding protein YhbY [Pullulanibacillus sp. KACC 23026]|uniref:ribosome assembly RNA-binding protein YhbY n=1 Tax=Pullulanibacillus sp. KACC 23026 TaxID=3028315 RepID=UPI0023AE8EFA|nr:ribosome assembly RNA-binding protein YhbY [Pullulanibacillus sp. KACC 23026]WEG14203.1 ribosome assembly RNA-binding protein YhbY [Pullulanibacillus sp. KACC 23026]
MLTGKQKRFLRKEAHHIKPVFQIGKQGIHDTFLTEINDVLEARELIKISVLQNAVEEPKEAGTLIADKLDAELVQVMGSVITLYKPSEENPTIKLP